MNRWFAPTVVACLVSVLPSAPVLGQQSKPTAAGPTTAAPAAPAKWVPPLKGDGTVEFSQTKPQRVKGEIVTKFKLRNTSKGALALLTVEELWYNTKREIATIGSYKHRALINPGDVIEFTISAPEKPDLYNNTLVFKHANGTIKAERSKKPL